MLDIKNIFINLDLKTRNDALNFISTEAVSLGIITKKNKQKLFDAFIKREEESTTGFQDGFAIPHARIKEIQKPAIIIIRSNYYIDWQSMDNQPIVMAIALLIPEDQSSSLHIDTLSKIATLLLDSDFRNNMLNFESEVKIFNYLDDRINEHKETNELTVIGTSGNIVG
ncbi:MAG: PTS sugar transporter subunit IIA, partial [Metamycoplasmataceae bacterium]